MLTPSMVPCTMSCGAPCPAVHHVLRCTMSVHHVLRCTMSVHHVLRCTSMVPCTMSCGAGPGEKHERHLAAHERVQAICPWGSICSRADQGVPSAAAPGPLAQHVWPWGACTHVLMLCSVHARRCLVLLKPGQAYPRAPLSWISSIELIEKAIGIYYLMLGLVHISLYCKKKQCVKWIQCSCMPLPYMHIKPQLHNRQQIWVAKSVLQHWSLAINSVTKYLLPLRICLRAGLQWYCSCSVCLLLPPAPQPQPCGLWWQHCGGCCCSSGAVSPIHSNPLLQTSLPGPGLWQVG